MFSSNDLIEMRESIKASQIYDFLEQQNGEPKSYKEDVIISKTICHGGESHKLYYYDNTHLFHCYTDCGTSFDIFELVIKLFNYELIEAIYYVINTFNLDYSIAFDIKEDSSNKLDTNYFSKHDKKDIALQKELLREQNKTKLPIFDDKILDKFIYPIILPWEREDIKREIIKERRIGYYPGGGQITIPHYDINSQLIGIRGRQLGKEEAERFGKYRPLYINHQLYNHPLGLNLYNLNFSKDNIRKAKTAIIFESEKSCLKYASYFGNKSDISTACCGSAISDYQIKLLIDSGAEEIIIGLDRQFVEIGDKEFQKLKNNLINLNNKYNAFVKMSFIFDKDMITDYKSAPIDEGPDKFLQLYKERITL